ncbi:MAG: TetR/AcrR family transcriptional regulator [Planctomycetes bacterium]|nr:TetR/AcrR family transcriptional regulator [Planctomycetota bacterium]
MVTAEIRSDARPRAPQRAPRARRAAVAPAPVDEPKGAAHRDRILDAAAEEFSRRGFHGTTARHVARRARVSVGNLYNHFRGMKELFDTVLHDEEARYFGADMPLQRVFADLRFPDDLERLATATHETVRASARYLRLIYVDVLEFNGRHIARLMNGMRERYEAGFGAKLAARRDAGELGEGDPVTALMATTLLFFNYFTVEELFGGRQHFGVPHERAVAEMSRLLRHGILPRRG